MLPTDERLDADTLSGFEIDLWLIDKGELVVLDGAAELADQRQAVGAVLVLLR